jgi:hypothetical protein
VASRSLIRADACRKHGDTSQLSLENALFVKLYYDIFPFHNVTVLLDNTIHTTMNIQAIEIVCRHRRIDFLEALERLTIIHQGYYG